MQIHGNNEIPFLGISKTIEEINEKLGRYLPMDIPILIVGNAGIGKDLLALKIHLKKNKDQKNFFKLDSTAIETEFSLLTKKISKSKEQTISNVTFYFDHIHRLNPESQNLLLKMIDTLSVSINKKQYRFSNTILIFSTTPGLPNLVQSGVFRAELYNRFLYKLILSDLKERKEDIPILVNHYLSLYKTKYKKQLSAISPDLAQFLRSYHWPGNIRQLLYVLEGMVALLSGRTLSLKNLPESFFAESSMAAPKKPDVVVGVTLEEYEKEIIRKNLEFANQNRKRTAKLLGISERNLYRKIIEYQLATEEK
jgi:DNA-binding NtrC family response regulator